MKKIVISLSAMIFIIANIGLSQDIINETGIEGKFIVRDIEQKEVMVIDDGNVDITGELSVEYMSEGSDSNPVVVWDRETNKLKTMSSMSNSWHSFGYSAVDEDGNEISTDENVLTWNQFNTDYGYIKLGPANEVAGHIYTDMPIFLFNKPVYSMDGSFSSFKSNNLNLQTNGIAQVTILESNGNVGIGTTTPEEKLHISGNMRLDGGFKDKDGEIGAPGEVLSSTGTGTDWIAASSSGGADADWTISGTNMYSTPLGNVGIGTNNPEAKLHVSGDDGVLFNGTLDDPNNPISTMLKWYPKKAAFRVGYDQNGNWDDDNVGNNSVATGGDTYAGGIASTAMGYYARAEGDYSTAMGNGATARAENSIAIGNMTTAGGIASTAMGQQSQALGNYSTAMGIQTFANGDFSTAMGWDAQANGEVSIAMGANTKANNYSSVAMGELTVADGSHSIAMGHETNASAYASTALGKNTTASGEFSTAMGLNTTANGDQSTAMGLGTYANSYSEVAIGQYNVVDGVEYSGAGWNELDPLFEIGNGQDEGSRSNAMTVLKNGNVGIGTIHPNSKLHIAGKMKLDGSFEDKDGDIGAPGEVLSSTGSGTDWIAASSSGGADADWTLLGTNLYSTPSGNVGIGTENPFAKLHVYSNDGVLFAGHTESGIGSTMKWYPMKAAFRVGYDQNGNWNDENIGDHSIAMGGDTRASGIGSTSFGSNTTAIGDGSTAMGLGTTANGNGSIAMGEMSVANGWASTAMGLQTTASGEFSTAMGNGSSANGDFSTAMGFGTIADGGQSTAIGEWTNASNNASTAMGGSTTASGPYSTAMGHETNASAFASTSLGKNTTANGEFSTAMGLNTNANGSQSTAMGLGINANSFSSLAIGQYNVVDGVQYSDGGWNELDPLFEIGNGQDEVSRSNAMTVLKNGNVGIGTIHPNAKLSIVGLIEYADNAEALSYNLVPGDLYRTGDLLKIVH